MAFPTVIDLVGTDNTLSGPTSTAPVTLSGSIVAGRCLLVSSFGNAPMTASAGWTIVASYNPTAFGSLYVITHAKIAAGGDTLTLTYTGTGVSASYAYQIDNWSGVIADIKSAFIDNNADPPSLTMGANVDNLWLPGIVHFYPGTATAPTNYTNQFVQNFPAQGGAIATARRALTAVTEDPGAFGGVTPLNSWTVGVAPAGSGAVPVPLPPVVVSQAVQRAANF